jgi:hypothetical protein
VPSERCSIEEQSIEYCGWCAVHTTSLDTIIISVFVGFSCIYLLDILIFKGLTVLCLCKSFGIKGLIW